MPPALIAGPVTWFNGNLRAIDLPDMILSTAITACFLANYGRVNKPGLAPRHFRGVADVREPEATSNESGAA